jgi:ketosteroid isomerase-like protein
MITCARDIRFLRFKGVDRCAASGLLFRTLMQSARSILPARAGSPTYHDFRLVFVFVLVFCAIPLCTAAQKLQKHENRHHEIDQLEEAWRTAVLASDTAAMNALLSDDYTAITANGTLQTKQEWLASLRSGRVHITTLDVSDRKVRFYGDTAVVTSRADVQGTGTEGEVLGGFRYTRVYVRNSQGKWKIVSFEASRIRDARRIKISSAQ